MWPPSVWEWLPPWARSFWRPAPGQAHGAAQCGNYDHQPSAGTQGQITDMALHLKRLETIKKRMNQILADRTGKPVETVTADCERDNFMSAQEALEYGLIDKVITTR